MRRFLAISIVFTSGLLVVLCVTDRLLGRRLAKLQGRSSVAPVVYATVEHAHDRSAGVRAIYLGDSVAHQFFPTGQEGEPDERYLTSNQAISLAGQYFVLADALASCPNTRDAYLFYYPGSFENDLGPPLANDYFCGFFHSPTQIHAIFEATHNVRLTAVQTGRLLLPNLLETNSANQPMVFWSNVPPAAGPTSGGSLGSEPILTLLNKMTGGEPVATLPLPHDTAGRRPVMLSNVSQKFLVKMRDLCRARGVTLHVLPCPCSDAIPFVDSASIYDRPILYEPSAHFFDSIHMFRTYVDAVRQRLLTAYGLPAKK